MKDQYSLRHLGSVLLIIIIEIFGSDERYDKVSPGLEKFKRCHFNWNAGPTPLPSARNRNI
jgi:hypothetical protein